MILITNNGVHYCCSSKSLRWVLTVTSFLAKRCTAALVGAPAAGRVERLPQLAEWFSIGGAVSVAIRSNDGDAKEQDDGNEQEDGQFGRHFPSVIGG